MPLRPETVASIREYLLTVGRRYLDDNFALAEAKAAAQPFHARLMPGPFAAWNQLSERSFSTRSGSWFQQIALLVARQFHAEAESPYLVVGQLKPAAESQIEEILAQLDARTDRRKPERAADIADVLVTQFPGGNTTQQSVDLRVLRHDGTELFFEMKTPGPNKDTSRTMKKTILSIMAMKKGAPAEAYASMAYNPYSPDGAGQPYTWNYALQFLEGGKDLLVGRDFWECIGDATTYDELLEIAEDVGHDLEEYLAELVAQQAG